MPARLLIPLTLLIALLAAAPAGAAKKRIYLSLGDSIAWGYARAADGSVVQADRDFSSRLAARARKGRRHSKKLRVVRFGCPGETTATYRVGGRCEYAGFPSQMAAARAFVRANRRRIAIITVSLGTSNFTPCIRARSVEIGCVLTANGDVRNDMPPILRSLRRAAGRRAKIAVANQYDPYLAFHLQGSEYAELALGTVGLVRQVNDEIRAAARRRGTRVRVADVFRAFRTGSLRRTTMLGGQPVPEAVAAVCRLTLMCRERPVGPDVHPTAAGYRAIAAAFAKALRIR